MTTPLPEDSRQHWDEVYGTKGPSQVSWFQATPTTSLALIEQLNVGHSEPFIDIGGGASTLVDHLLDRGHRDLTVLDISAEALDLARQRLGWHTQEVHWIRADLRTWTPPRQYACWHDRAVFHFLTSTADRAHYRDLAAGAIVPGGHLILATFASDGPDHCSGLPVTRQSPADLASYFGDSFTPLADIREEHTTPAGAVQPFTWFTARRKSSG